MGSGRLFCVWGLLALVACNQVLGLEPPAREVTVDATAADDAHGDDGDVGDAHIDDAPPSDGETDVVDARPIDARPVDAAVDAPISSCGARGTACVGGGYCNGASACVPCTTDTHCGNPTPMSCTMPVCSVSDTCVTGPAPRNTFCNNWADQCDGLGNCVDCTNSGGCDECCACFDQVCRPV